jgi:hypothetical protein
MQGEDNSWLGQGKDRKIRSVPPKIQEGCMFFFGHRTFGFKVLI